MRTFSFALALVAILASPTLAGRQRNDLPGIGTFAYNGAVVTTAVQHMAALELR